MKSDVNKTNLLSRTLRAFTVTELIGVLSIIALLTAVVTPSVSRRMDQAAKDSERESLNTFSEALVRASLNARQVPAAVNFQKTIAGYLNRPTTDVGVNGRKLNRVFLADPNLNINGGGLPYTQAVTGSANPPSNARLMVVSSIGKALPVINAANFDNIWTSTAGAIPTSMAAWGGRGEDLLIERVELAPRFHKVVLVNVDLAPNIGRYSVDSSAIANVAPQTRFAAYYMDGTVLNLYRPDGTLDFPEVIRDDVSFVYQNNRWGLRLGTDEDEISDFGSIVDRFLQQPVPCDPAFAATQRSVVNAFYDYLWGYADWAFGDPNAVPPIPPFSGSTDSSTISFPAYSVVNTAQTHLDGTTHSFTGNLIK